MDAGAVPRTAATMVELLRQGKITPTVAERLPLSDARRARAARARRRGKLVLVP